jgi:hypothetical protein
VLRDQRHALQPRFDLAGFQRHGLRHGLVARTVTQSHRASSPAVLSGALSRITSTMPTISLPMLEW